MNRCVRILGTHGIPAAYGGFETAAENIALFLKSRGWRVIVYCQVKGEGVFEEDVWNGIERVRIGVDLPGWKGTSRFDLLSIRHACKFRDLCLTFGYNTALFSSLLRFHGIPNVINMDGIEWSRARWGFAKQAVLYVNERIACFVGNHLIADHPEIEKYLWTRAPKRKVTTITYGAHPVVAPDASLIDSLGVVPGAFLSLIARPIPENSILEIVQGFSASRRNAKLVILGKYEPAVDEFHRQVMAAASDEVVFAGAIYDPKVVEAIRYHSLCYVHGHTVGGTNPSLVEAMAASNPVIAQDNPYNRWVAQDGALYFKDAPDFDRQLTMLLGDAALRERLRHASRQRYEDEFTWERVAGQYEKLLEAYLPAAQR